MLRTSSGPALPVLHLVVVVGVERFPEPVGDPAAVELLAPLVVLEELVQQCQIGTLSLLQRGIQANCQTRASKFLFDFNCSLLLILRYMVL